MDADAAPPPPDFAQLYPELKRLARGRLRRSGTLTLLDTTALVHETWLRMSQRHGVATEHLPQFFAYAAKVMRSVVVDHARTAAALEQAAIWSDVLLRPDEADRLLREARAIHVRVWPAGHFQFARWAKYHADVLAASDRRAESAAELQHALASLDAAGSTVVRESAEVALVDQRWRSGQIAAAAEGCRRIAAGGPLKVMSVAVRAALRCSAVAVARGDLGAATAALAGGRAIVAQKWPDRPERSAGPDVEEARLKLAAGQAGEAVALARRALERANATDGATRSRAWLLLAQAQPDHHDLQVGGVLDRTITQVDALPAGYFVEWQAALQEAAGRARLAQGALPAARQHLEAAVRLRERADQGGGVWLAQALDALAQAQRAAGAVDAAKAGEQRAAALRKAAGGV